MGPPGKSGAAKASNKKPSSKSGSKPGGASSKSGPPSKSKKPSGPKPAPVQHKPKTSDGKKKKPPHMRYSEKELKVPKLNGIVPAGVSKPPNAKKGKNFVDDKESMNMILAMVMAEKEGNIESKMMRARQMEEVREARRIEAEKRTQSKKESLEDRKQNIKDDSKKRRRSDSEVKKPKEDPQDGGASKKAKLRKRVSFG